MPWIIVTAWGIITLALLAVWYLLTARAEPAPATGPPPDPWAADVAEFRRQVHDWDRDGR